MTTAIAKNGHPIDVLEEVEINWIQANLHLKNAELAQHFGVNTRRIRHLMRRHNIERYKVKYWSELEINFLKENYNSLTSEEIGKVLGRTKKSVMKKRRSLRLKLSAERRSELGRLGQKLMSRPSTYRDEGEVWFLKNIGIWMTKQNGKNIHWRRWAYEKHHGPIPKGAWKDGDNSKPDPAMLQLTPSSLKRDDYSKARMYVQSIISRQAAKSMTWYIANGYGIVGCRFGSVWINEGHASSLRMKKRIEEINIRWPRHWKLNNQENIK